MSQTRLHRKITLLPDNARNQSLLRGKIRLLEEQVGRLQSGMNMFAQLQEKSREFPASKSLCQHENTIRQLQQKIMQIEQQKQRYLRRMQQLEQQNKENIEKVKEKQVRIDYLQQKQKQLQQDVKQLEIELNQRALRTRELQLENSYYAQENNRLQKQLSSLNQKYQELMSQLQLVDHHLLVHISHKEKLIMLKQSDWEGLKNQNFKLKLYIAELESADKWRQEEKNRSKTRKKLELARQCPDIAHEIVRLKKDIDRGLGDPESQHTDNFLKKFGEMRKALDTLQN